MKWLILVFTSIIIGASTCKKNDCIRTENAFQMTAKAFPDYDSIPKNDTIWFEITSPKVFTDINTGKVVDFSNAVNFSNIFYMYKFIGGDILNPGVVPAGNPFEQKVIGGTYLGSLLPDRLKEYKFLETSDKYSIKIGFVPKDTGVFSITIADPANVYTQSDQCNKSSFRTSFSNTSQHIYFLQNNRPGYTITESELRHHYCFKVK